MTDKTATTTSATDSVLSRSAYAAIDKSIAKYPEDQRQSAVMDALTIAQKENENYLTDDIIHAIADYLRMPVIAVYEVATFYSMYNLNPQGRYHIEVCTNISCQLCGAKEIVKHLEKRLDVKVGETTADGRFTLKAVECLAACVNAPMMQIGDDYHENLTPEKVDQVLEKLAD